MIPVLQTEYYPKGNCMAACLASILEIPLESIPNDHSPQWYVHLEEFVNGYGYSIDRFPAGCDPEFIRGYQIAVINSPRGDWLHALVALDGVIVWDPFDGSTSSDSEIIGWDILVPIRNDL